VRPIVWAETARADYRRALARIRAENPAAARRVSGVVQQAIEMVARRNIGRRGRVEGTFEKSVVGLPYVIAYALEAESEGTERLVILRIIHASRDWPAGEWPKD
jgi:toxin ParE1/3/4